MSIADRVGVPLNSRCSRKCEQPASGPVSSRLPVSTQAPIAADRTDGIDSEMTRKPLGRVVSWWSMGRGMVMSHRASVASIRREGEEG